MQAAALAADEIMHHVRDTQFSCLQWSTTLRHRSFVGHARSRPLMVNVIAMAHRCLP